MKALFEHPQIRPEIHGRGLQELVLTRPVFPFTPGTTPFANISELRGGRSLRFTDGRAQEREYWKLVSQPHPYGIDETVDRLRDLLTKIVAGQLVSDVPVACTLSGGLDSGAITALAAPLLRKGGKAFHTWCIDFVDSKSILPHAIVPSYDAPVAQAAAEHVGSEHHLVVLDAEMMVDNLVDAMRARDLPIALQVDTSLLLLMRRIKKEATVVLSGEGGDEVFGGYHWMAPHPPDEIFPWSPRNHDPWPFFFRQEILERARPGEYIRARYADMLAEVPRLEGEVGDAAQYRESAYLALRSWLPDLLDRNDRVSMAAGVEARVPMCDRSLVEFLWNIPRHMQWADGIEKSLLRRVLRGVLPASVVDRKKSGFPQFQHDAYYRALITRVLEILAGTSQVGDIYDVSKIRSLCEGKVPPEGWLFAPPYGIVQLERIIQTDAWIREYGVTLRPE